MGTIEQATQEITTLFSRLENATIEIARSDMPNALTDTNMESIMLGIYKELAEKQGRLIAMRLALLERIESRLFETEAQLEQLRADVFVCDELMRMISAAKKANMP